MCVLVRLAVCLACHSKTAGLQPQSRRGLRRVWLLGSALAVPLRLPSSLCHPLPSGVRALVYGSLLGAVGLAGGVTWAVRSSGISSGQELGERVREAFLPLSANMRGWLLPVKHRAQAWLGPPGAASGSLSEASSGGGGVQLDSAAQGEGGAGFGGDGAGGNGGGAAAEFSRRMQQRYNTKGGGGSAVF